MLRKILLICSLFIFTLNVSASNNPQIRITTNLGEIEILLNSEKAPKTVANFVNYINDGFYSGTVFHRVIKDFMIQGGGFTANLQRKENNPPIINEANNGLQNIRGSIAMARTNEPHSATSQFFINTKDNAFLNHTNKTMRGWGYTVFGNVTKGMNVIDKMNITKTGAKGIFNQDVPVDTIVIQKIELINDQAPTTELNPS